MGNPHLRLVTPAIKKRTVTPRRAKNSDLRTREYLTQEEIETLMAAARQNRYGHRDATVILIAFRHGLRASEAVDLRWDQVDFNRAVLHVRRVKQGTPSVHPLTGLEMRALRRLQQENDASPFVFVCTKTYKDKNGLTHGSSRNPPGWATPTARAGRASLSKQPVKSRVQCAPPEELRSGRSCLGAISTARFWAVWDAVQ